MQRMQTLSAVSAFELAAAKVGNPAFAANCMGSNRLYKPHRSSITVAGYYCSIRFFAKNSVSQTFDHRNQSLFLVFRASGDNIEPFDDPNQFARLGERRRAMWCIGQAVQRRRRADLVHRRPAYQAFWTSLRSPCGRPGPRRRSRLASRPDKPVKWFDIAARCSNPSV